LKPEIGTLSAKVVKVINGIKQPSINIPLKPCKISEWTNST